MSPVKYEEKHRERDCHHGGDDGDQDRVCADEDTTDAGEDAVDERQDGSGARALRRKRVARLDENHDLVVHGGQNPFVSRGARRRRSANKVPEGCDV